MLQNFSWQNYLKVPIYFHNTLMLGLCFIPILKFTLRSFLKCHTRALPLREFVLKGFKTTTAVFLMSLVI